MTHRIASIEEAHKINPGYFPPKPKLIAYGLSIAPTFHPTDHGAYFVTSIKRKRGDKRMYQVRFLDGESGRVVLVHDGYETNYGARMRAEREAEGNQHGCRLCRELGHSPAVACRP